MGTSWYDEKFKRYVDEMVRVENEMHPERRQQGRVRVETLDQMVGIQRKVLLRLLDQVERLVKDRPPVSAVVPEPSLRDLQLEIGAWSARTFPASTPHSTLKHLWAEVAEVDHALDRHRSGLAEETADLFILLVQFCTLMGIDLAREVQRKHGINQARAWREPDEFGVVYHAKEG